MDTAVGSEEFSTRYLARARKVVSRGKTMLSLPLFSLTLLQGKETIRGDFPLPPQ